MRQPRLLLATTLLAATLFGLGCGLLGEKPPPPPPEPMPLILPTWVMDTWQQVTPEGDRPVVRLDCQGDVLEIVIGDDGRITVGQGDDRTELLGTGLDIGSDGSLTITLSQGGRMRLEEVEPGVVRFKGGHPALAKGGNFVSADAPAVERLFASAEDCGARALDLSGLSRYSDRAFSSDGDPCMQAGLLLSLGGARPELTRMGMRYRIVAAARTDAGTWVTLEGQQGGLHGMRIDPTDAGLRVWQRTSTGMSNEQLEPVRGRCER